MVREREGVEDAEPGADMFRMFYLVDDIRM